MERENKLADFKQLNSYKATVARGLEDLLENELKEIGASSIKVGRGVVHFQGSREVLYRANLASRTAMRILMPLFTFRARYEDWFYENITDFPWERIFGVEDTFAIDAASRSRYFQHTLYMSQLAKDAIVDRFRDIMDDRPSVDTDHPHFRIHVHAEEDSITVSLDSSGEPLYKRGYRKSTGEAPLKETLAAALVLFSGWQGEGTFLDPMCGSGTIPIEAALIAKNRAPGIHRRYFGFMNWRDYSGELFESVRKELRSKERDFSGKIVARDNDSSILEAARKNAMTAGFEKQIHFEVMDFMDSHPPGGEPGVLLMNPPYDERMPLEDQDAFYKNLGDVLKQNYPGYDAWIFSGAMKAMRKVGLKPDVKLPLYNGAIESQLCRYQMIARC